MRLALFSVLAVAVAAAAHGQSFQNGDFSDNGGAGQVNYDTYATSWSVPGPSSTYIYATGTADVGITYGQNGDNDLWGAGNGGNTVIPNPPSGSNWFAASASNSSPLQQSVSGLSVGTTYLVDFNYAYAQKAGTFGVTQQYWAVNFGTSPTEYTPLGTNPSQAFSGWYADSAMSFVATASTETLSFSAVGAGPGGFSALDGITLAAGVAPGPPPTTQPTLPMTTGPSFVNGNFSANGGPGQINYNTSAPGWYVPGNPGYTFIYASGTADKCCTYGQYGDNELWGLNNGGRNAVPAPPSGTGFFIAQDGDFQQSPIDQDISGLVVGKTYTVGFDYGYGQQSGFYGDTQQNWGVSLGDSAVQYTPTLTNPSQGFTGWLHDSFSFVADSTTETLSFLAYGSAPVPPFAVLADVTFSGVPEPTSWSMLLLGVAGLGGLARRRRASPLA